MQNRAATWTPDQLKRWMSEGRPLALVDVREPDEHAAWRIPGSRNVPLDDLMRGAALPEGPLVLYCASGARSAIARQALAARGIDAADLSGGMVGWSSVYDVATVAAAGAEVLQVRRVGKGCLSYLVVSDGEAAVVDPSIDVDEYLRLAKEHGVRIVAVVDTHAHADHASGSQALVEATGATYHAPDEVGPQVPHTSVREGTPVRVGGARLDPLATPGHTPGSVSFRLGDLLFTGDTLFVESVGRPDLGQDSIAQANALWETIHERVLPLGDAVRILPGHFGDAVSLRFGEPIEATLGELRARLAPLGADRAEFVGWTARNAIPKPANFETIKRFNRGLVDLPRDIVRMLEAGPNGCAVGG